MHSNIVISLGQRQFRVTLQHVLSCSIEWHHHMLGLWPQPSISSLQSVVGCDVDAMLLPIDVSFVHEVSLHVHDDLACSKHAKYNRWYRSEIMWPLNTLLDFSPADFKLFPTVLADRCLFGNHCLLRTWSLANGIRIRMTSDAAPCLHAATLHVVFWILATLPRCWFGCVFSQADPLSYNNSPSDVQWPCR